MVSNVSKSFANEDCWPVKVLGGDIACDSMALRLPTSAMNCDVI